MKYAKLVPEKKLPVVSSDAVPPKVQCVIDGLSNPWAIHPETALYLSRYILQNAITHIVEFGAGSSSLLFAASMASIGGGSLTSIEENPLWCKDAWIRLEEFPSVKTRLIPARTRLVVDTAGPHFGYEITSELGSVPEPQMVFVDAPQGPLGRSGGVHLVIRHLPQGSVIFFDDTARKRDHMTVTRLLLQYPELSLVGHAPSLGRGLTMLGLTKRTRHVPRLIPSAFAGNALDLFRARAAIRKVRSVQASTMEQA